MTNLDIRVEGNRLVGGCGGGDSDGVDHEDQDYYVGILYGVLKVITNNKPKDVYNILRIGLTKRPLAPPFLENF